MLYVLGGVIVAQLGVIVYLLWRGRDSAVPDAMEKQAAAEIKQRAAEGREEAQNKLREGAEADALAQKTRADRAERIARDLLQVASPHLSGDALLDAYDRVLSATFPDADAAAADRGGAAAPEELHLRPVDPFGPSS